MSGTLAYTVATLRAAARSGTRRLGQSSSSYGARRRIGQPINQPFNAADPCPSSSSDADFAACCASNRMTPSCAASPNNPFAPQGNNPFAGGGTGQTSADASAGQVPAGASLFPPATSTTPPGGTVTFLRFGPMPSPADVQQPQAPAPTAQPGAVQRLADRVGLPVWALALGAGGVVVVGYLLLKKDEARAA